MLLPKLLVYRLVPVALRPAMVLLEGALPGNQSVLVLTMPIAMMAFTLSGIPVQLEYYKSREGSEYHERHAAQYIQGVTWLALAGLAVLLAVLQLPIFKLSPTIIVISSLTFIIEKFSNESARYLEFQKRFSSWLLVQILRSGWMVIPIIAASLGANYKYSCIVVAAFTVVVSLLLFVFVLGRAPAFGTEGLRAIRDNVAYFVGTFLPASYRQLPRIFVARLYPEYAHIYLALSQVAQGAYILFNVRFQIPYRQLIARRTALFYRRVEPAMRRILAVPLAVAVSYSLGPMFMDLATNKQYTVCVIVLPIVLAEALLYAVMSAHLECVRWIATKVTAATLYLICIIFSLGLAGVLAALNYLDQVNVTGIPVITIAVGFIWILFARIEIKRSAARLASFYRER